MFVQKSQISEVDNDKGTYRPRAQFTEPPPQSCADCSHTTAHLYEISWFQPAAIAWACPQWEEHKQYAVRPYACGCGVLPSLPLFYAYAPRRPHGLPPHPRRHSDETSQGCSLRQVAAREPMTPPRRRLERAPTTSCRGRSGRSLFDLCDRELTLERFVSSAGWAQRL
ncbi:PREDICTED: uncharacterized protein LOC106807209 [Priapulus caudatus]|uniref:Uncharacterized protein LOC106807209 n=1 Tax=Priapulus caudatus TaxID=37621 RepID=A0ABM1DYG0_PRICU|nr:PREDICTED: uncharacterized protein LOC106807209 [Priapulus caudatus]